MPGLHDDSFPFFHFMLGAAKTLELAHTLQFTLQDPTVFGNVLFYFLSKHQDRENGATVLLF